MKKTYTEALKFLMENKQMQKMFKDMEKTHKEVEKVIKNAQALKDKHK